jgi:hypothetical protein
MHTEKSPSLLLPKLAAMLFVAMFLSGMSEIICLATTTNQSVKVSQYQALQIMNKPHHTHPVVETSSDVFGTSPKTLAVSKTSTAEVY